MTSHEAYEVGKMYKIPTVQAVLSWGYSVIPVLGPRHNDKEFIGFYQYHYHWDFRFATSRQIERLVRDEGGSIFVHVIKAEPGDMTGDAGAVTYRWRKCRRVMPPYPLKPHWLPAMSAAYTDKTLVDGHICPHKGADLTGLPVDAQGCVTCPLHGLRWHVETGRLTPITI